MIVMLNSVQHLVLSMGWDPEIEEAELDSGQGSGWHIQKIQIYSFRNCQNFLTNRTYLKLQYWKGKAVLKVNQAKGN